MNIPMPTPLRLYGLSQEEQDDIFADPSSDNFESLTSMQLVTIIFMNENILGKVPESIGVFYPPIIYLA
jgi:vacuolar-type H+-ATPase subunit F/Vma7